MKLKSIKKKKLDMARNEAISFGQTGREEGQ